MYKSVRKDIYLGFSSLYMKKKNIII